MSAALVVDFDVLGMPAPQGSKRAVVRNGKASLIEASASLPAWRSTVAAQALRQRERVGRALDGPCVLLLVFRLPMPASRPAPMRAAGTAWHPTTPDLDKLTRAVGDALTSSGLLRDDARIVHLLASKVETLDWTGVRVVLGEIANDAASLALYLGEALK